MKDQLEVIKSPMEEIIQKAISGGYSDAYLTYPENSHERAVITNVIILDPLFFQALGRSLGWWRKNDEEKDLREGWHMACSLCGNKAVLESNHWYCKECYKYEWDIDFREMWLYNALQFMSINFESGFEEAVKFLNKLIIK